MSLGQRKVLLVLDILGLILSVIVALLFLGLAVTFKTDMKFIFFFIYIHAGYSILKSSGNIIHYFKSRKVKLYSMSKIDAKSLSKISF